MTQCLAKLLAKSKTHEVTDMVAVLDADVAVVKSDAIISEDLKEELKAAVRPLENTPDQLKDWHPGSDEKALDLVHPSLFPLFYSRTRVLPTGSIDLRDCAESCNEGEVVPIPKDEKVRVRGLNASLRQFSLRQVKFWSKRFQWLPCDVQFAEDDKVKITTTLTTYTLFITRSCISSSRIS